MSAAVQMAPTSRFPALDGVRALAAFGVVFTHVGFTTSRSVQPDLFGAILARGDFGVTVFFLLSGFLLYRPFALRSFGVGPAPLIAEYFWRRTLRILPALWLMTAFTLVFITNYQVHVTDWVHYLLLIQTYDHHDFDPNLTQLWTLCVEVSFYTLLPILASAVGGPRRSPDAVLRRQVVLLGTLLATALAFNIVVSHTPLTQSQALLWLPGYVDWFAAGMALAVFSAVPSTTQAFARQRETLQIWANHRGHCWLIGAALFFLATLPIGIPRTLAPATHSQWTTQHYLYGSAAFFFLLPFILGHGGRASRVLGSRVAHLFGSLSYSIYLWHVPVMLWLQRRLSYREFHGHFPELIVLTVVITVAVAAASWFLVEQPILRYGSRPWRGNATAARTPVASAAIHNS